MACMPSYDVSCASWESAQGVAFVSDVSLCHSQSKTQVGSVRLGTWLMKLNRLAMRRSCRSTLLPCGILQAAAYASRIPSTVHHNQACRPVMPAECQNVDHQHSPDISLKQAPCLHPTARPSLCPFTNSAQCPVTASSYGEQFTVNRVCSRHPACLLYKHANEQKVQQTCCSFLSRNTRSVGIGMPHGPVCGHIADLLTIWLQKPSSCLT